MLLSTSPEFLLTYTATLIWWKYKLGSEVTLSVAPRPDRPSVSLSCAYNWLEIGKP